MNLNHDSKFHKWVFKKDIKLFKFLKNFFNEKFKLKSSLDNAIFIFFVLMFSGFILIYLIAPFNVFFLKLLLVFKLIFFLGIALFIFLIKR